MLAEQRYDDSINDDTSMGDKSEIYGFKMPNVTPEEQEYLDQATSNEDFMRRMVRIARQMDQRRQQEGLKYRQSADNYMDTLSEMGREAARRRADPSAVPESMETVEVQRAKPEPFASKPVEPGPVELEPVEAGTSNAAEIDEPVVEEFNPENIDIVARLQKMHESRMKEAIEKAGLDDEEEEEEVSLEEGARRIAELQRQIREEIGLGSPSNVVEEIQEPEVEMEKPEQPPAVETIEDMETGSPEQNENPSTVDKQIQFLEHYLEKLEREANEEKGSLDEEDEVDDSEQLRKSEIGEQYQATMRELEEHVTFPTKDKQDEDSEQEEGFVGLENTAGEMSAEEKIEAFAEIRRQAMAARGQEMPSGMGDPFNVTLPEQREPDQSQFGRLDDGDEPSPDSEAEYDAMGAEVGGKGLLLEEIAMEIQAYVKQSRNLLKKHETRMDVLLARLKTL